MPVNLPVTHRWVYGEAALAVSGNVLTLAPDGTGTIWDDFTNGTRVTDLYDEAGNATTVATIVGGVVRPIGVPVSVNSVFADFGSGRFALNQVADFQRVLDAAASIGPVQAAVDAANARVAAAESRVTAIEAQRASAGVVRVVYAGSAYPQRAPGVKYAEWIGPIDPGTSAVDYDTWIDTSAASAA